MVAFAVSLW